MNNELFHRHSAAVWRRRLGVVWRTLLISIVLLLFLALYTTRIEPYWIQVTHLEIPITFLRPSSQEFTLVQLSDLHFGLAPGEALLPEAIAKANAENPDLVILTGDYVDAAAHDQVALYAERAAHELAQLRSRYGTYAVLGNHDLLSGEDIVAASLQRAGISVLRNELRSVQIGDQTLWLLGVEDAGVEMCTNWADFQDRYRAQTEKIRQMLREIPIDDVRLLLTHNPDFSEINLGGRVDLALAGHTHGSYVRFPLLGAPVTSSCFGQRLVAGLEGDMHTRVYINEGLGGISFRFGARPEVTVLRLVPASLQSW